MNQNIHPENAWQPFVPDKERRWDDKMLRHLYRRAGFAASASDIARGKTSSPAELANQLVSKEPNAAFEEEMDQVGKLILTGRDPKPLAAWWLYRMAHNPDQALEKATFFWHGHFATSAEKVANVAAMQRYYELLRQNAFGSFEQMVQGISQDAAMLIYLDATENRKTHPNENYARELMELFCLGLGTYTENDIQEIARCFTGSEVKRAKYRFNKYQHDKEKKTVFGTSGNFAGEDAVRLVVGNPAAATFIATKLVRFYVADEPAIPENLIAPLADQLRGNGFDLGETIRTIFSSNIFYSDLAFHRKVRSPVELVASILRTTGCRVNFHELATELEAAGQVPFYPPNVKGWDGGRKWINSSTLIARSNLVRKLLKQGQWSDGDAAKWLKQATGDGNTQRKVDWLLESLVATDVPDSSRTELLRLANDLKLDRPEAVADLICAISTLPEFHLN